MKKITIIALLLATTWASAQTTNKKTTTTKKATKTTQTVVKTPAKTSTSTTNTTTNTATSTKTTGTTDLLKTVGTAVSSAGLGNSISSLSNDDIVSGLKDALSHGATNASSQLNAVNGFYGNSLVKIPFPQNAQKVADQLRSLGFGSKVDDFEKTLNHAAETAAKEAAPIFVNAITSMSFTDAKNILTGSNNSATKYLQNSTSSALNTAFTPHIKNALDNTLATQKWSELAALYNKIPFVTPIETDLVKYTTTKALSGLFTVLATEETKIRKDPAARVTDIMKKVFGATK